MALTIKEKQDYAWLLFKDGTLTQKAIAERVGVAEKTICDWKEKFRWEDQRKSLLTTKAAQLTMLYNHLDAINEQIRDEQKNIPDSRQADAILKLTAAIKNLETEISVSQVFEVGKDFIQYVQKVDFEKSKEVIDYYDGFIKECLKNNRAHG